MGKLMTDKTGQDIVKAINNIPATGGGSGGGGTEIDIPPNDGQPYVMKDGKWTPALVATATSGIDTTASQVVVNKDGEASVTFHFPWRYATQITKTLVADNLKTTWVFPYDEGILKSATVTAGTEGATINLRIDDVALLSAAFAPTATLTELELNRRICRGQKVEIEIVSASNVASDLTVTFTLDVGHKTIEYIGETVAPPNVIVCGYNANMWGGWGITPDGEFKIVDMPPVVKLHSGTLGFTALAEDGTCYIAGNNISFAQSAITEMGLSNRIISAPVEVPNKDIVDIITPTYVRMACLKKDGKLYGFSSNTCRGLFSNGQVDFDDYVPELKYIANYSEARDVLCSLIVPNGTTNCSFSAYYSLLKGEHAVKLEKNFVLSDSGKIYDTSESMQEVEFPFGKCKNLWADNNTGVLAQNEDNELYAKGLNCEGHLGLGGAKANYDEWQKVGVFDIKKLIIFLVAKSSQGMTFLLTNDGALYHAGGGGLICEAHNEGFVRIFKRYRFVDIAFSSSCIDDANLYGINVCSLIAIAQYIGKLPAEKTPTIVSLMHFDTDAVTDAVEGMTWTATGTQTVNENNAKFGNALQLAGNQWLKSSEFELGGDDFSIDFWGRIDPANQTYPTLFILANKNYNPATGVFSKDGMVIEITFYQSQLYFKYIVSNASNTAQAITNSNIMSIDTALHHYAMTYFDELETLKLYVDGVCKSSIKIKLKREAMFAVIGHSSKYATSSPGYTISKGTVDELCICDNSLRWINNFTPPDKPYTL